jgi:hypothetical protein
VPLLLAGRVDMPAETFGRPLEQHDEIDHRNGIIAHSERLRLTPEVL